VKDELIIINAAGSELVICDVVGHVLEFTVNGTKPVLISGNREVVNVERLPKGVYIVQIINAATGNRIIKKIFKE